MGRSCSAKGRSCSAKVHQFEQVDGLCSRLECFARPRATAQCRAPRAAEQRHRCHAACGWAVLAC